MKNKMKAISERLKAVVQILRERGRLCNALPKNEAHKQQEETTRRKCSKLKCEQEIRLLIRQAEPNSETRFYRKLLTNEPIGQLSNAELLSLVKECQQHLDPEFFLWLKLNRVEGLSARSIILCILIRLHKNADEIEQILGMSHGTYRTYKSRLARRLQGTGQTGTFERFLQELANEYEAKGREGTGRKAVYCSLSAPSVND